MRRMLVQTCDVAVIGAGVFGAWTAYQLGRSGLRVKLVDAFGGGNSLSSSGDASRIMRLGYGADEIYSRSAQRSLQLWKELFADIDEQLFYQTGVLWLAYEDDPYPVNSLETLVRLGVPAEKLSIEETQRRYPQLNLNGISWALLENESGVLAARTAVQTVIHQAVKRGVEYFQEAVRPPSGEGLLDFVTTESGERISAGNFVFTCGAWLPKIFPDLLANRIHPTRQEVFYFDTSDDDEQLAPPSLPTWIDFKNEAYGLPKLPGYGVKVAIDRHGPLFDPDTGNRAASEAGLAEARRYLARRLPALKDAPMIDARVCQYENTSNGDFLIDRHPEIANVWLVGGGSGHGFKHGPFVGEYVAARIEGKTEGIEPRFVLSTKQVDQRRAVF